MAASQQLTASGEKRKKRSGAQTILDTALNSHVLLLKLITSDGLDIFF
jgi:hypothetical protein